MIVVSHLAKRFKLAKSFKLSDAEKSDPRLYDGHFHSVVDVSFTCAEGEVLGLLGPNGAGKTTTLRMLSTALSPDQGSIVVGDVDVIKKPLLARKKIGFLSGSTGLYGRLSARENVEYFGRLHGMKEAELKRKIDELFELLDIHSFASRRAENLSTGMKQKTSIARAVVHSPEVVVLDEPTTGLDIMATQTVMNFIQGLKTAGTPVIFSTHHLDEVQLLCDKVCIIDKGRDCFNGSIDTLLMSSGAANLNQAFLTVLQQGPSVALVSDLQEQSQHVASV